MTTVHDALRRLRKARRVMIEVEPEELMHGSAD